MEQKSTLDDLVLTVVKQGASDLHLSEKRRPIIRVAGSLSQLIKEQELSKGDIQGFLKILLSPEDEATLLIKKEVDFSYAHNDQVRFRGNAFFRQGQIAISLRLIPHEIKTLEQLGLPPVLETFTQMQQGFFLVVGPTGHGKSTTLAAIIEMINKERMEHILTIEDPVEYIFDPKRSMIDQREVRRDTPNFASALKGVFRQDADVIMIGEMRELETISTAVTAAETGHMVFSTLHTNTAGQTIERIIDSFPTTGQEQIRLQLAGSLAGIFSQRLIPRVSGGLIPAYELLINNNAVSNLIRENRTHEINTVIETGASEGMIDMNRTLAELVAKGEITAENAFRFSTNQKILEKLI